MTAPSRQQLDAYRRKRDFARTAEPAGGAPTAPAGQRYVMHKHAASHDHFDLRLERDGALMSWALPKGPSLASGEKRLAVEVEDHPLEYGDFEGTIPKGQYGGGTVMLWDTGTWEVTGKNSADHLDIALHGQKLTGNWTLVRTRPKPGKPPRNWLMIRRGRATISARRAHQRSVTSGRTMAEIARGAPEVTAQPAERATSDIPGARRRTMPTALAPQLATLASAVPDGEDWIHEIKYDGYRILAHLDRGSVRLLSRNGLDWTRRFPAQAGALERLPVERAILDGEMVALTRDGSSSFGELQEALSAGRTTGLVFQLFDLLHLNGYDLTASALAERKRALQTVLESADLDAASVLRYSDHVIGKGPAFLEHACEMGLEGIMAKRDDAHYVSRRSTTWRKIKCTRHAEFVVGGYTAPAGARQGFGSLLLGAHENGHFRYAGRVGTGFNNRQLTTIHRLLRQAEVEASPFSDTVPNTRGASWVRPELVVEVEYAERTREGRLRHPTFRGIREDRHPDEITMTEPRISKTQATATPAPPAARPPASSSGTGPAVEGIRISSPDRVVYPDQGVTKLALAEFYAEIQDWLMPWMANRLLSLVRCPEGRAKSCFYQKHLAESQAPRVPRQEFRESKGVTEYLHVQSIAHVIALVQSGVLEFHVFGSQVKDVEHPDLLVFDLDPSPGVSWATVLRTARDLRERLQGLGLPPFLRTTGGKGLHLVVPIRPAADWDEAKAFAKAVAAQHAADDPRHLTTTLSRAKRKGKILIDYLRNGRGATAIASYSTRARPGAPVAVPIRWSELTSRLRPDRYTVGNLRRRLGALKTDPWEGFYERPPAISGRMRKAVGLS
ncbi:MAG TPA: DNA ligase D [Gemmatimonadales bacterium]|nr:DNA ligase D [Gemmatimonadales bacterium]